MSSGAQYSSLSACQSSCGGGGSSGYSCNGGTCTYVSNGAQYSSLSACQNACGGGNDCTNMTSYLIATSTWINNCGSGGNNDLSVKVTNNSNQTLYIRIEIQKTSGVWSCGGVIVSPGDYGTYWTCSSSGNYKYGGILNSEFGNGCFGACGE